jgi:hypothetical protein
MINPGSRWPSRGQAMVEFTLLCSALLLALFLPYLEGKSPAELLWLALIDTFAARSFLISIH